MDMPLSLSLPAAQSSGAVEEILDRENLRMADSLASKVTRLKSVSSGPLLASSWHPAVGPERVEAWKGFLSFPPV